MESANEQVKTTIQKTIIQLSKVLVTQNTSHITNSFSFFTHLISVALLGLAFGLTGCERDAPEERAPGVEESSIVVEITATHDPKSDKHLFELSKVEIPSGWTTFRLVNNSPDEHLAQTFRVPEDADVTAEVWIEEYIVEFQRMLNRFQDPEIDGMAEAVEGVEYPDWVAEISPRGGPGLIGPGYAAEAMAELEPGHYIIECYVKDENEMMHTTLGMAARLVVTADPSGTNEPDADIELTVSDEGIQSSRSLEPGEQNIRVNFEDRDMPGYRNVHLVRLDNEADLERLSSWMNAWLPGSFVAPAPVDFIGGTGRKPAGHATYFTVDVEPGDYAWVSEYPVTTDWDTELEELGLLQTFTVEKPSLKP